MKPCVIWLTGLSGAGKTTVAELVEQKLLAGGHAVTVLDGDILREWLTRDLGFSAEDRTENVRRVTEYAAQWLGQKVSPIVAMISPFRADRRAARNWFPPGRFIEVFIDTPLEVCEQRDPKGMYRKARAGEIPDFTGISSPYEPPESPELRLDGARLSPQEMADRIMDIWKTKAL